MYRMCLKSFEQPSVLNLYRLPSLRFLQKNISTNDPTTTRKESADSSLTIDQHGLLSKGLKLEVIENDFIEHNDEETESTQVGSFKFAEKLINVEQPSVEPVWQHKSYAVSTLIERSKTLKNFVDLGVDLARLEPVYNVINFLLRLKWETDVMPRLKILLTEAYVPYSDLGTFITQNPWIFQQEIEDIQVRLNFLESKGFSKAAVASIVTKAPLWLNFPTKKVKSRLKFYQEEFRLKDNELCYVITKDPDLVIKGTGQPKLLQFSFKEEMGFSANEAKELMLKDPKIWTTYKAVILQTFNFLHNDLGMSHKYLLSYPRALRVLKNFVEERHEFLKHRKMNQYDPEKPNYVSLKALVGGTDEEFCLKVAKCSINEYNLFSKLH